MEYLRVLSMTEYSNIIDEFYDAVEVDDTGEHPIENQINYFGEPHPTLFGEITQDYFDNLEYIIIVSKDRFDIPGISVDINWQDAIVFENDNYYIYLI